MTLDAGHMKGGTQDAAKFAKRGHEGCPLPAGARARRRTIVWRHGNAGQTGRRLERRDCAAFLRDRWCCSECGMGVPTEPLFLYRHAAMDNTVSGRRALSHNVFRPVARCFHKRRAEALLVG